MSMATSLDALFRPKSVAVIGASRRPGSIGAAIFHNLLERPFQGVVYPVNPNAQVVRAVRAYPTVCDIPDEVELGIICVPKELVLDAAKDCAKKGVRALIVISAGFKEVGEEGKKREDELLKVCQEAEMRLVGPNCFGIQNTDPKVQLDATFSPIYPPAGNVAFSSQSGGLGLSILSYARSLGIGISNFASVGNKPDIKGNDLIEYWSEDPRTDMILLYFESFGDPQRFIRVARDVSRRKPIVAVKSGRSARGALAAASHTGSLAGSDAVVSALFKQTGVIRVDTVEELFDMAMLLGNQELPGGNRLAILTNAGGPGILAADACERWGLDVPPLSPETTKELDKILPKEASIKNPVDMIATASGEAFEKTLPLLINDPQIDAVLIIYMPPGEEGQEEVARAIRDNAEKTKKPIVTCFMGMHGIPGVLTSLKDYKIPSYSFPESAVSALARAWEHAEWRKQPEGSYVEFSDFEQKTIKDIQKKKGWLTTEEAFNLLEAAGITTAKPKHASNVEEAIGTAKSIGFPVVLKVESEKILHKSDFGGVALDLQDADEVKKAVLKIYERAEKKGVEKKDIRGFSVQKMVAGGQEILLGAQNDPRFGPLLVFGLGGVLVELLRDVSYRLHPLTNQDAHLMIREIRGASLFQGYRGGEESDVAKIEEMLLRLSQLLTLVPEIQEFDLNPVKVFEKGQGAIVLDARIRLGN